VVSSARPEETARAAARPRRLRAGRYLVRFGTALALPILGFVAILLWQIAVTERARLETEAVALARATRVAIDRELAGLSASLQVLALSRYLRERDLAGFYEQAAEMRDRLGIIASLRDASGQQLLNTRRPFGETLPRANIPDPEPGAWTRQDIVVSDVFVGALAQQPLFAVQVQVPRGREAEPPDILSLSLPVARIRQILLEQNLPEGWTVAVVDGSGTILARNARHDEFVGRNATRDLQEATARGWEGSWRGFTVDGSPVLGAYARSEISAWRLAVGAPEAVLREPYRRFLLLLGATGMAFIVTAVLLALLFGRRIAVPLQQLAASAREIGRGAAAEPVPSSIREVAEVGDALMEAGRALRRREDELRQLNAALEERVAERTADLRLANARLQAEAAEREAAEAKLRQAQKMEAVGRLTGGVAHDFNNLLTVVLGNLAIARRRLEDGGDPRLLRAMESAAAGAQRAAELTQRLLAFSRQQPLAPAMVDANRLVAGMSDLLRRTLGEDIQIETVLAGGMWKALADPNQLEAALLNLAVNARDAMPGGGKLTIETANAYLDECYAASREDVRPGQYVMISVSDTGTGMPADVVARAFEPFFTTKPVGRGTGLGLSQVYGFAKQSGGHAAIYSEPGHGTTVKLYLPRLREPAAEPPALPRREPLPEEQMPRGRGEIVLVAEDEPMVRDFAVAALEEAGYRVLAAEDGPSTLALLEAEPEVALLFTDVVLTGPMNGRMLADAALARRPRLAVLFTTGYTRNAIIHHGRLDEGVNFLGKPYSAAALAAKVQEVLAAARDAAASDAG
jgi:signal transduction histidine kinase